ncbi:MAG: hypothetical protein ACMXYL_03775 [Candidatus Woesearchaeota archaeon]
MAIIEMFCIDTRIRDHAGKCIAYHYSRTIEDESIIVQDNGFKPYIIVTSPFHDVPYDSLRDRILTTWNQHKNKQVYIEEKAFKRMGNRIVAAKASFDSVEDYFYCKRLISEMPERFLELFSKTTLKKKYYVEKQLIPLTLWKCDATSFPMNARVKTYQTSSIVQQDTMTYTSPRIMSTTLQTSTMVSSYIYDNEPIRSFTYTTEDGSSTITWDKSRGLHPKTIYVLSEIDLIDKAKRSIVSYKPAIIAGYDSDKISYPRMISRAENYAQTQPSARLNISDDFSLPYSSRYGISIHGFVHIDTKIIAENIQFLQGYEHLKQVLEQNHETAGGGLLIANGQTEREQAYTKLVRDAATSLYPFIAELSKMVAESLFDVSRFSSGRSFQSYYETVCLKNNYYPEESAIDDGDYSYPGMGEEAWFDEASLVHDLIIEMPHACAEINTTNNISKETYKCKCCMPEENHIREWYCTQNKSQMKIILEELIELYNKYDGHRKKMNATITTPLYAKAACISFLIQGYEKALQSRSNPLYFPHGIREAEQKLRKITANMRDDNVGLGAIIDKTMFIESKHYNHERTQSIIKEVIGTSMLLIQLDTKGSVLVKDDKQVLKAAYMTDDYEIRHPGRLKEGAGFCSYASNARDLVIQRIIETRNKEKALGMIKDVISELYQKKYDPTTLIIFTTIYQPLDKYERETLFVKAGKKLEKRGYSIIPRTRLPYIIVRSNDELDALIPFTSKEIEDANIALEEYANRQVIRAVMPYAQAVHITRDDINSILEVEWKKRAT